MYYTYGDSLFVTKILFIAGSDNLINAERAKIVPKNRQGDYTVKRLDPDTKDGTPARFVDAEDALEADLLKDAIKQEKSRRDRKPKHDF